MNKQIHTIASYNVADYDKVVTSIYRDFPMLNRMHFLDRIILLSAYFLGRPYLLGAAGEGGEGHFDQAPLYRFDCFDCVTYINTVLALALSRDVVLFQKNLIRLAYREAQLGYANRHHFMSVDWNVHNQSLGLLKDVTEDIVGVSNDSIIETAEALIDRPNWFRHRSCSDIRLLEKISKQQTEDLLKTMRGIADDVQSQHSQLPYVPIRHMFDKNANPIESIFKQIPQGAIIEIVRPNWNLKEKIGTNLNVSHVGFAIWKADQLFYRQASSIEKRVIDIPLTEYLRHRLESPTVKGINVQAAMPG